MLLLLLPQVFDDSLVGIDKICEMSILKVIFVEVFGV